MFPTACSLRSTQCAALIALATAAGISRFETAAERSVDDSASQPPGTSSAPTPVFQSTYFRFALQALAPWLHFFDVADRSTSRVDDSAPSTAPGAAFRGFASVETATAIAPSSGSARFSSREPAALPLSVFEHAFPFAVGPPAQQVISTPRAEGTVVPCDSAARRILSVRIAANARPASPVARLARLEDLALRGEPLPNLLVDAFAVAFAAAVLPARLA